MMELRALRALGLLLGVFLLAPPAGAKKPKDPVDLINPELDPALSQWLVGPVVEIASEEEVEEYLSLSRDDEAQAFIERFWERRRPEDLTLGQKSPRQLFDERSEEADKRFSEAAYLGRRTDRGTIFVLHGPPEEIDYEINPHQDGPPIEVWRYPKGSPEGLHGERPARWYKFVKEGDQTVFYRPRRPRPRPLRDRG